MYSLTLVRSPALSEGGVGHRHGPNAGSGGGLRPRRGRARRDVSRAPARRATTAAERARAGERRRSDRGRGEHRRRGAARASQSPPAARAGRRKLCHRRTAHTRRAPPASAPERALAAPAGAAPRPPGAEDGPSGDTTPAPPPGGRTHRRSPRAPDRAGPPRFLRGRTPPAAEASPAQALRCGPVRSRRTSLSSALLGADEPGLVGEDDRLDAVAQAELGEQPRDVRLDRRLARRSAARRSRALDRPCATSSSTSRSRGVSSSSAGAARAGGGGRRDELVDQPPGHRRREQRLARRPRPGSPSVSCSGPTSLSRKPLAPARSAS